jgi:hypothetical protein
MPGVPPQRKCLKTEKAIVENKNNIISESREIAEIVNSGLKLRKLED